MGQDNTSNTMCVRLGAPNDHVNDALNYIQSKIEHAQYNAFKMTGVAGTRRGFFKKKKKK